jgi:regulatory protein
VARSDPAPGEGEQPLERALARCYRHLGEREHSAAELRRRLVRAGIEPDVIEEALAIVTAQGYLDDVRYARLLVEDRRRLDGWGAERIRERLQRAGIERELIEEALSDSGHASELAAATALLRRRWPRAPSDDRERQRALGQLIRIGYESEVAYDALRAYERDSRADEERA